MNLSIAQKLALAIRQGRAVKSNGTNLTFLDGKPPITDAQFAALAAEVSPVVVTRRQIRLWLVRSGRNPDIVDQIIASMPASTAAEIRKKEEARVEWEDSVTIHPLHPLAVNLGQALGLTGPQRLQAFIEAAAL